MSRVELNQASKYYSRLGSKIGYDLIMGGSQHFGFYKEGQESNRVAQENYHMEFDKLLDLKPGFRVLDAGSGQGVVASYLAKLHPDVNFEAITITPYEVGVGAKRAKKNNLENVKFKLGDFVDTRFENNSFDVIYTTETLSHAKDVYKVILEFKRLLKPGGRIVLAEYEMNFDNLSEEDNKLTDFIMENAGLYGWRQCCQGAMKSYINKSDLNLINELDWTMRVKPGMDRIKKIARPIARRVEGISKIQKYFVNTIAARVYSDMIAQDKFWYKIYIARK